MRNDYIEVILDRSVKNVEHFFSEHTVKELTKEDKVKVLKLLEMQRNAMLMYSSDGWFFDEISGIETIQILQYAARAMQLAREVGGVDLEPNYVKILERAPSNIQEYKNGAEIYNRFVKPNVIDLPRVGAHYAVSSLFKEYPENTKIYCYTANSEIYDQEEEGNQKLAMGRASIRSDITWEEGIISFAVLYVGGQNLFGGVHDNMDKDYFSKMCKKIKKAFQNGDDVSEVTSLIETYFDTRSYSLRHLFTDEQRKILSQILEPTQKEIEDIFRKIYKNNYPIMQTIIQMGLPPPPALSTVIGFILNMDISKLLEDEDTDLGQLQYLVEEMKQWFLEPDKTALGFAATQKINILMQKFSKNPKNLAILEAINNTLKFLNAFPMELNLWKAQNTFFSIGKKFCGLMKKEGMTDPNAKKWIEQFTELENFLGVKCM